MKRKSTELTSVVIRGIGYGLGDVTYQVFLDGGWHGITRKKIAEIEAAHIVILWNPSR